MSDQINQAMALHTPEIMDTAAPVHDHSKELWWRMDNEPHLLYQYFKMYCRLGEDGQKRTHAKIARQLRKNATYIGELSSVWQWNLRAQDYDNHIQALEDTAREQAVKHKAEEWAERREELREAEWALAMKLIDRAKEMLDWPMIREIIETGAPELNADGILVKQYLIKEPNNWTLTDVSRFLELASKLARLATGMETSRGRVNIDFSNLSDEQLKKVANGEMP